MFCRLSSVMDLCFVLSATLCFFFFVLLENSFLVYVLVVELSFDGFVWLFNCWLVSDMKSLLTESVIDSFFFLSAGYGRNLNCSKVQSSIFGASISTWSSSLHFSICSEKFYANSEGK